VILSTQGVPGMFHLLSCHFRASEDSSCTCCTLPERTAEDDAEASLAARLDEFKAEEAALPLKITESQNLLAQELQRLQEMESGQQPLKGPFVTTGI
jgi:hypothetical protein